MVFQSYALYPHMTVRQNISFSLRVAKAPKDVIERRTLEVARMLQLEQLLDRKPAQLSGGQRQRVAIGRALVREPEVFLFDEPLSNLDAMLRVQMRVEIAKLHNDLKSTMIYVTHDQVEAMTLADKIVVLRGGRVEQAGAPLELYHDPANRFVAGFIGSPAMNFVRGTVDGGAVRAPGFSAAPISPACTLPPAGSEVILGLRPGHLALDLTGATHRVDLTEALGGVSYVYLTADTGERVVVESREDRPAREGSRVGLSFRPEQVLAFDARTERRLR
jgi:lactose/L-arabinose transport system ATP-binding protein